jgi:hypothetical protein
MRKQAEKLVAASVVLALVVALGAHELSAQPSGSKRTVLHRADLLTPVAGSAGGAEILGFRPGHTHPGEEVGYVRDGTQVAGSAGSQQSRSSRRSFSRGFGPMRLPMKERAWPESSPPTLSRRASLSQRLSLTEVHTCSSLSRSRRGLLESLAWVRWSSMVVPVLWVIDMWSSSMRGAAQLRPDSS